MPSLVKQEEDWVILAFIAGAVVLGLAGLMYPEADVATRHDCYNLATVLGSAAAGGYAGLKMKQRGEATSNTDKPSTLTVKETQP